MYGDGDSDTESTSKTSGRSQHRLAPLQVKPSTDIASKPQPKTRTLRVLGNGENEKEEKLIEQSQSTPKPATVITQAEIQRPRIIDPIVQTQPIKSGPNPQSQQKRPQQPAPTVKPATSTQSIEPAVSKQTNPALPTSQLQPISTASLRHGRRVNEQMLLRRPSRDQDHLSIACHLFPRLSETNLNFHDIYWGMDPKTKKPFLRKRMVNVSKLFSFHSLQLTNRQLPQPQPPTTDESQQFRLHLLLVDLRPRAAEQIVSNVLALPIQMQQSRFGLFCQKSPAKPILVRSNYKQAEVVLRVQLLQATSILGHVDIPLLDPEQRSRLGSRTQMLNVGDYKFAFDAWDPPTRLVAQTDSLPDILLCLEEWIQMLAMFRQLSAEVLAEREQQQQTTWITDPVMATFPSVCEIPRLVEIFLFILNKKQKYDTSTFRRVFMQYVYPIVHTIQLKDDKHTNDCRLEIEKAPNESPLKLLAEERSEPLNVFHYAVHLSGYHALD